MLIFIVKSIKYLICSKKCNGNVRYIGLFVFPLEGHLQLIPHSMLLLLGKTKYFLEIQNKLLRD